MEKTTLRKTHIRKVQVMENFKQRSLLSLFFFIVLADMIGFGLIIPYYHITPNRLGLLMY